MARIDVTVDNGEVSAALSALSQRLGDPRPLMQTIGEYLVVSTKERFPAGVGPSGVPWPENSPVTLARKKGNRPLIGETKRLGDEILIALGTDYVEVGSNLGYAAVQQLGAAQGAFGRTKRNGPIPWGTIPARPFLGLSDDDATHVLDIVQEHLESVIDAAAP